MPLFGNGPSNAADAIGMALALAALVAACGGQDRTAAERGRQAYTSNCIACHNPDPAQAGGVGPAIAGSSRELLEARILRAEYPSGYSPKHDTQLMPAQPYLAPQLDDLVAYLASIDAPKPGL